VCASYGIENRTSSLRVIGDKGTPSSVRLETRVGGADINPYTAIAGCLAMGLSGVERRLPLTAAPVQGVAASRTPGVKMFPRTLGDAVERFNASATAREWLGDGFVDHYVASRRREWKLYCESVSDWQRARYFECI